MLEWKGEESGFPMTSLSNHINLPQSYQIFLLRSHLLLTLLCFLFIVQRLWIKMYFATIVSYNHAGQGGPTLLSLSAQEPVWSLFPVTWLTTAAPDSAVNTLLKDIRVRELVFCLNIFYWHFWKDKESTTIKTSIVSISAWNTIRGSRVEQSLKKCFMTNTLASQRIILGRRNVDIDGS